MMLSDMPEQQMVANFHEVIGQPINRPELILSADAHQPEAGDMKALRKMLHNEELAELHEAMDEEDLCHIAKELADLLYVILGTAVTYGIPVASVFAEVHNSNMTKKGGKFNEYGKLLKPDTYRPAEITLEKIALWRDIENGV